MADPDEGRKKKTSLGTGTSSQRLEEEESSEEEDEIEMYRRDWISRHGRNFGSFEHTTTIPAMRFTFGRIPQYTGSDNGLQVFSIKLILRDDLQRELHWPLHVYGLVAARDSLDPRRNLLFNRSRDDPHILTQHHPFLELTGPSRAIVLIDPVHFEVQLKAKSLHDPHQDDETLHFGVASSGHFPGPITTSLCERSEVEFRLSLLEHSIEATIISVQLVDGSSWPDHLPAGRLVSRKARIYHEDFVLLDSRQHGSSGTMPIDDDGVIQLSRRVVMVELAGQLTVEVLAFSSQQQQQLDNDVVAKGQIVFNPKTSSVSVRTCDLGGLCKLRICVAWSLVDKLPPAEYFYF